MDENAMTKQDLSEEDLQQITGACDLCVKGAVLREENLDKAANYKWLAEARAAHGLPSEARRFANNADFYMKLAKINQMSIDERRGTPGHPPALGESSNAVPDLNQPRLH
jgi:hypothetical protein